MTRDKPKRPEPRIIFIRRAPKDAAANYCTVTEGGALLRAWEKLSDISAWYKLTDTAGTVKLVRQLEKTYTPQAAQPEPAGPHRSINRPGAAGTDTKK